MFFHLSIAQLAVFVPAIVGAGLLVGFLSGLFGVGGGFLITPLLMFLGIPTDVAVATGANQAVATSASAAKAQWQLGNVDLKMGVLLLAGGGLGSLVGVNLVVVLRALGQIDLVISICYAVLLGILGLLMLIEGVNAMRQAKMPDGAPRKRSKSHYAWVHGLPLKTRFPRSKLYMSAIPPVLLGIVVGLLGAVMGVGGGFLLVPAMIYLLKMSTRVVIGTSLVQVLFVSSIATIMHATQNKTVDIELALMLIVGGVIGAQWGGEGGVEDPVRAVACLARIAGACGGSSVRPTARFRAGRAVQHDDAQDAVARIEQAAEPASPSERCQRKLTSASVRFRRSCRWPG